jgi:thioredoxin reductase
LEKPVTNPLEYDRCDVDVIGAGPTGLAAAVQLKKKGIDRVIVLDRESSAGGIPRHCGHHSFGVIEYARLMTGPVYAKRLAETTFQAGVQIALQTSVTHLGPGGVLTIATPKGTGELKAKRVLIATGARETPRSARLVSGGRMLGISTTGALQSMVYLKNLIPFRNPLVVGTEIVSFSALLTCKKAGIKPAALIEENAAPTIPWPFHHAAGWFGVPLFLNTRISKIMGRDRVENVRVTDKNGTPRDIACDGVLFTGLFTPESTLARMGHLVLDPGTTSPVVDRFGRCSDPAYYAAGNLLPPLNMALNCWRAGRRTGRWIARDLTGILPPATTG